MERVAIIASLKGDAEARAGELLDQRSVERPDAE